jgi:tRNA-dihydrouridine synthase 1
VKIPIFCKIRLLDTIDDTIQLCRDLRNAGASLIAVHARYRATWDRKGPGARDGPALLDQVKIIKQAISDIPIITNVSIKNIIMNLLAQPPLVNIDWFWYSFIAFLVIFI